MVSEPQKTLGVDEVEASKPWGSPIFINFSHSHVMHDLYSTAGFEGSSSSSQMG